jgi:hypothetical protein
MAGLVPAIHVRSYEQKKRRGPGMKPGMMRQCIYRP